MYSSNVTVVVHTYNRPHFLYRLLRYYSGSDAFSRMKIIIADGGSDESWGTFERITSERPLPLELAIHRYPPDLFLYKRLRSVINHVETPYLILAADDDFYF